MIVLEGALSVKAAIQGRQRTILSVYIDAQKDSRDITYIIGLCERAKISLKRVSADAIREQAKGKTHGGIIATVSERKYQSIAQLGQGEQNWLLLIEGVEDPFNLGQMIRTAYAAGCGGILLNARDWSSAEATLLKSSAGAFDRLPIALSSNLETDLKELKQRDYQLIIGYRDDSSIDYRSFTFPDKTVLAIGGELRGLSKPVIASAQAKIAIRYPNEAKVALNAVSACAVLCFEIVRQRKF